MVQHCTRCVWPCARQCFLVEAVVDFLVRGWNRILNLDSTHDGNSVFFFFSCKTCIVSRLVRLFEQCCTPHRRGCWWVDRICEVVGRWVVACFARCV